MTTSVYNRSASLLVTLVNLSLLLVAVVVVLSSYLRLTTFGLGCADWPACYGALGISLAGGEAAGELVPGHWTGLVHRIVASVLGLCIVALALLSLRHRRHTGLTIPWLLLALVVFLSWLGYSTPSPRWPVVAISNLLGGMLMLGLLWWLSERTGRFRSVSSRALAMRPLALLVLIVVVIQIGLGGWVSANFAATACDGLLNCNGSWWSDGDLLSAFSPLRELPVDPAGRVTAVPEQPLLHMLHRYWAWLTAALAVWLGLRARCCDPLLHLTGLFIVVVVLLEVAVGYLGLAFRLPVALVVAHNALAALLLLAVLHLIALLVHGKKARYDTV